MNDIILDGMEYLSKEDVCTAFSISDATLKNWIRLKKIKPPYEEKKQLYFKKNYIENLKKEIESGKIFALKSRRNKKFVSGNGLYKSYLPKNSPNIEKIKKVFEIIESENILLTQSDMNEIIADCARKLFISRVGYENFDKFDFLISDISGECKFINNHSGIKNLNFEYREKEDILGLLYISLRDLNSRKSSGVYYTPVNVVEKAVELFSTKNGYEKIVDPCCGTGNFLINLNNKISFDNIYGFDIDDIAIKITRINIALKYLISDKKFLYSHFKQMDFLNEFQDEKFDIIVGNPPWGYNFSQKERQILQDKFNSAKLKGFDSYEVFVEKAINSLHNGGFLYFVIPEAILNVKKHEKIREYILENTTLNYLEFLGNIFDKVQCESIILGLKKEKGEFCSRHPLIVNKHRMYKIGFGEKRSVTSECFSFYSDDEEYKILSKISKLKNKVYLKDQSDFALGIVTGNNNKFLSKEKLNVYEPIVKGSDIFKYGIKIENYIKFEPKNFQQCAPELYYRAPEKLLYKFIGGKLVFAYDNNQTLCLNSCNIVIPHVKDMDIRYIQAILNSKVVQFYFDKTFNSLKILRSHIEKIPIPVVSKNIQDEIVEIVSVIENSFADGVEYSDLEKSLDEKIAKLYNLSIKDYEIISKSMV